MEKDNVIKNLENKMDDLLQKNIEKDSVIEKLIKDVKDLTNMKDKPVSKGKSSASKKKKEKENIEKDDSEVIKDNINILDKEKEHCEKVEVEDSTDKNQVFIKNSLKLLGQINWNKMNNDEDAKSEYFNILTQIEREKEKLGISRFDLLILVKQMSKFFPNQSEFTKAPSTAIPKYVETVRVNLKKMADGENVTTAQMFGL